MRSEIYQLQLECDKLAEEVDRNSADSRGESKTGYILKYNFYSHIQSTTNPLSVPLGETNEEFYQSIYKGQEFVGLPTSNSVPLPLPSQPPAWEPVPRRIAEPRLEDEEDDGPAWICVRCTFGNHPLMSICEECNLPRIAEGAQGTQNRSTNRRFVINFTPTSR